MNKMAARPNATLAPAETSDSPGSRSRRAAPSTKNLLEQTQQVARQRCLGTSLEIAKDDKPVAELPVRENAGPH